MRCKDTLALVHEPFTHLVNSRRAKTFINPPTPVLIVIGGHWHNELVTGESVNPITWLSLVGIGGVQEHIEHCVVVLGFRDELSAAAVLIGEVVFDEVPKEYPGLLMRCHLMQSPSWVMV
jgi:hypothetical protein